MSHVTFRRVLAPAREPGRDRNIALWLLQVAAAAMFLLAGSMKLAGAPPLVALFGAIGIGQWFRYVTGGLEVLGAVALLVPPASGAGALLLAAVMVLLKGHTASFWSPIFGKKAPTNSSRQALRYVQPRTLASNT